MKKILYIHIGTGKTGTSSIQNFGGPVYVVISQYK